MFSNLGELVSEFRFDIFTASLASALVAVAVSFFLNWRMNLRERKWREVTSIIEAISAYCSDLENVARDYWSQDKQNNDKDKMLIMEKRIITIFLHITHFQTEFHNKTSTHPDSSQEIWADLFKQVTGGAFERDKRDKDLYRILLIARAIIKFRSFFYQNRQP